MSTWSGSSLRCVARLEHLLERLEGSSSKVDEGAMVGPLARGRSGLTVCFLVAFQELELTGNQLVRVWEPIQCVCMCALVCGCMCVRVCEYMCVCGCLYKCEYTCVWGCAEHHRAKSRALPGSPGR